MIALTINQQDINSDIHLDPFSWFYFISFSEVVRRISLSKVVRGDYPNFWGPGHIGVPRFGHRLKDYHFHDHIVSDSY